MIDILGAWSMFHVQRIIDTMEKCMSRRTAGARFTLIELLVVIAVIAILMSMLLPALARSRYVARNTNCVSNLKQVAAAWLSYSSDFDEYYPDYGEPTPDAANFLSGARRKSMDLAIVFDVPSNPLYPARFDLRPLVQEYLAVQLNEIMKCPLASPSWETDNGPGDRYDIDDYNLSAYNAVQSTYQLFPSGHSKAKGLDTSSQMQRAGNSFIPSNASGTAYGLEFRLLAADVILETSWSLPAPGVLLSTQMPYGAAVEEGGNHVNNTTAWEIPPGIRTTANFASDDGSVKMYSGINYYSYVSGEWLTQRGDNEGYYLPADAAE
jgi:prepilin-type N-terminal cleavage/methylation domain-containing protein